MARPLDKQDRCEEINLVRIERGLEKGRDEEDEVSAGRRCVEGRQKSVGKEEERK